MQQLNISERRIGERMARFCRNGRGLWGIQPMSSLLLEKLPAKRAYGYMLGSMAMVCGIRGSKRSCLADDRNGNDISICRSTRTAFEGKPESS
jgi:hypothetical protein